MAKGPASTELRGDTQVEFSRLQRQPEQKHSPDKIGVSGAIGALNQDNPQVKDRTDLKNLAAAGRRKYRRFNTIDDYRESKLGTKKGGNSPENTEIHGTPAEGMDLDPRYLKIRDELKQKWLKEHPGEDFLTEAGQNYNLGYLDRSQRNNPTLKSDSEGIFRERYSDDANAYDIKEKTRVYEDPQVDPAVKLAEDNIIIATNNEVKDRSFGFDINWQRANRSQSMRGWRAFAERYPEKAAAYTEKHPDIKAALEEIKRQEQAKAQAQTREQVQAESDQILADSVRVGENDQAQTAEQPNESNAPEVTTAEVKTDAENELLSTETVGTQAILLLGGEIGTEIDRAKIEAIAAGGPINTEKANKASLGEREDYWNGENSPHKNMTFEQQLERWKKTSRAFLNQYKGKPEAEFFGRIGVDLENEEVMSEIYDTYFVKGKGDIGLFTARIAQNNSAEQIRENTDIIQKWGLMYGEKSSKIIVEMTMGIKNAQTDIDSFIQSAQAGIDKGDDMPGIDLVNLLNAKKENPDDTGSMQTSSIEKDVTNSSDLTGAENTSEAIATDHNDQEFKLNWDKRASSTDTWSGGGDLKIEGDVLAFTPQVNKLRNPYSPGTTEYDYFEKYQVRYFKPDQPSDYFLGEQRKRVQRGVELAVDSKASGELSKVPTPLFWKIIEADPELVDVAIFDKYLTLENIDPAVKSITPVDLRIHNSDGKEKNIDVNFSWQKLRVDKQTLIAMQQKAIDYIESQVAAGKMDPDMLATAKSLMDSHKAPKTVRITPFGNQPGGENPETPREHTTFLQHVGFVDFWNKSGTVRREGGNIIYENEKLKKKGDARTIQIATQDPENENRVVLTKHAWDILKNVPKTYRDKSGVEHLIDGTNALTNPTQDRQGVWKRFVKPFKTDTETLARLQGLIRDFASENVSNRRMDESVLKTIGGLAKYKYSALEPQGEDSNGGVIYKLAEAKAA